MLHNMDKFIVYSILQAQGTLVLYIGTFTICKKCQTMITFEIKFVNKMIKQ